MMNFGKRIEIENEPLAELGGFVSDDTHYETKAEVMYDRVLKFCHCGRPEDAHAFMCEALAAFDRDKVGWEKGTGLTAIEKLVVKNPTAASYVIAYILDERQLLEHGGSVDGAWLTNRGKQFLEIGPMGAGDAA